jgi:hypothetical protein
MRLLVGAVTVVFALGGTSHSRVDITAEVGSTSAGLQAVHATLRCDGSQSHGTGGLEHRAKRACRFLGSDAFARLVRALEHPGNRACSQIYGGPQNARLRGRLGKQRFDVTVTRTDGCGISSWQALRTLLGDPERSP